MKCAVPYAWELQRREADTDTGTSSRLLAVAVALFTTSLWAAIIGLVCWSFGISIGAGGFAGIITVIFAVALLGQCLLANAIDALPHGEADQA